MKEELEEGHFDGDGHFQWKKEKEIKDHWLDNLDWVKIKKFDDERKQKKAEGGETSVSTRGLADSSSSSEDEDDESLKKFDVITAYRRILELMKPAETIKKTLQRLGKQSASISSIERFKRKKAGIIDENAAFVTEITELTNKILTKMGNMNIYEETYEEISKKYASKLKSLTDNDAFDMYAETITEFKNETKQTSEGKKEKELGEDDSQISWEYKWKMDDTETHGPFTTEQMQKYVEDGFFKDGVFVKKFGTDSQFHSSNRIDFDLYL